MQLFFFGGVVEAAIWRGSLMCGGARGAGFFWRLPNVVQATVQAAGEPQALSSFTIYIINLDWVHQLPCMTLLLCCACIETKLVTKIYCLVI